MKSSLSTRSKYFKKKSALSIEKINGGLILITFLCGPSVLNKIPNT